MSFVLSSLFFVFLRPSGELAIMAACRAAVRGSKPLWGANAAQARMVVQLSCKQKAVGSNPTSGPNTKEQRTKRKEQTCCSLHCVLSAFWLYAPLAQLAEAAGSNPVEC